MSPTPQAISSLPLLKVKTSDNLALSIIVHGYKLEFSALPEVWQVSQVVDLLSLLQKEAIKVVLEPNVETWVLF